uniref:N-terminal acetyltransferase B complex subunit MDM20 homolog n=1 Tax=Rhodnius prolixus TaxID=13249 RepID=T1IFP7_RHOPR
MTSRLSAYPVSERRLRPIYDWLDNGNNKKALQEADKVLKKQPNLQCAKVLRCLALLRLGKENDCIEQLEAIKQECPVEEASLQAMTVCYREIHKPHLICDLYEKANLKEPGNEEILTNLFLSYVRVGDYKKQQQTAMTLYKVKKKNQYYFWCVISILLQAVDKLSDLIHALLCSLAEKMLEKLINEDKVETEQEILIYLTSLELQGKTERALEVLDGPLSEKLEPYIVLNKRVNFLIKLGKWEKVNEIIMQTLETDMDSWNYHLFYLDSVFELGKDKKIAHEQTDNCQYYKAKIFIHSLIKKNETLQMKKRGPYLAQLEYYSRLISNSLDAQKLLGKIVDLILRYYEVFGSKECCVHDLRPYLPLMSENECIEFLSSAYKLVSLSESKLPKTKLQMNLMICNMECSRVIGIREMFDVKSKCEFASNAVNYFIHSLQFNTDLQPTEAKSGDRFALFALHSLFDLWVDTEDGNYLFEAIVICHYALSHSPSNSQFKTLLLKFYHLFGACKGAHNAYLLLDVKHMQLDTLGYLHLFPLISNGDYTTASEVITTTMKFFTNNFKESADHITFAYKYEALTKIPEFIWVREKLNNSTHYMKVRFERMLLDIFFASSHANTLQLIKDFEISPLDKIQWNILQDNRDFSVLWDIDPKPRVFERECIKQTYNHDIILLRLRCLLLHLIAGCIYAGLGEPNNSE